MSPKTLPGVTRVTNAPQGRPAPRTPQRIPFARAVSGASDQWLLRNKIGLAMILSGVAFGVLTSSLLFGFVAWFGIILFFQKRGDEVGFDEEDFGIGRFDYPSDRALGSDSFVVRAWHDPTKDLLTRFH